MNSPKTPEEALQQCDLLWAYLEETGSHAKTTACLDMLGYMPLYACPACEYAIKVDGAGCDVCPVREWRYRGVGYVWRSCTHRDSPYSQWYDATTREQCSHYAAQVRQLIQSNMRTA